MKLVITSIAAALLLGGCAVVPVDHYPYGGNAYIYGSVGTVHGFHHAPRHHWGQGHWRGSHRWQGHNRGHRRHFR